MKLITIFLSLISGFLVFSQDESLSFTTASILIKPDSVKLLDFKTSNKGTVIVYKDQRLEDITDFIGRQEESIEGTKIDGYRVQIFFAESSTTAQSQKASFLSSHSEHKAYIDYMAPNYRVRVGNFRTRLQAEHLKQQLISVYPTCIVLEDKIELPVISTEE
tara:strand:+ start:1286 stop:1771 length:486 start_codon:yes stop_codon:yes gene_type:complete